MPVTSVKRIDPKLLNLKEQVVSINRVTKVVKGGKNLSFSALVVVGDPEQKVVGYGMGKAKEVPSAIKRPTALAPATLPPLALPPSTAEAAATSVRPCESSMTCA